MAVNVKTKALSDNRFATVARICGLADADHARGKMLHLWEQCTQEQTYTLTDDDVVSVLGERAVEALVRARLGEAVAGGVRIRGTEGRIEWLGERHVLATTAGKVRAKTAVRGPDGRMLPGSPSRLDQPDQPATPAEPASVLDQPPAESSPTATATASSLSDHTHSGEPEEVRPVAKAPARPDRLMALTEHALRARWDAETKLHRELKVATPPPANVATAAVEADARKAVQGWMLEAPDGEEPAVTVGLRLDHLIAVRSAVARDRRDLKFWAPSTFWNADGIAKDLRQTPAQAVESLASRRVGPRVSERAATAAAAANQLGADGFKRGMPPILKRGAS